nr:MAG TPA: hypothetical protein [Caudoviricetes sp.]
MIIACHLRQLSLVVPCVMRSQRWNRWGRRLI